MLLPSAMACDPYGSVGQSKPQRPNLPSFGQYQGQHSYSSANGLATSCRALQSILGERLSTTPSPHLERSMRSITHDADVFPDTTPTPVSAPTARGTNKRSRDECEDDDDNELHERSQRTHQHQHQRLKIHHNPPFSTPRHPRRGIPLAIPAGLQASDFEALTATATTAPRPQDDVDVDICMSSPPAHAHGPHGPHPSFSAGADEMDTSGSARPDRLLVDTVLTKLAMCGRDWSGGARQVRVDATRGRWEVCGSDLSGGGGGGGGLRREMEV